MVKKYIILILFTLFIFSGCSDNTNIIITPKNMSITGLPYENNEYMVTIDETHFCNHDGKLLFYSDSQTLQNNQNLTHFIYNDGNETHVVFEVSALQDTAFMIYEGARASNNGTALITRSYNRNFNYNTNNFKVWKAPTLTTKGTLFYTRGIFSKNTLTTSRDLNEIILKKNTNYTMVFTSLANSNRVDMIGTYYNYPCIVR